MEVMAFTCSGVSGGTSGNFGISMFIPPSLKFQTPEVTPSPACPKPWPILVSFDFRFLHEVLFVMTRTSPFGCLCAHYSIRREEMDRDDVGFVASV